MAGSWADAIMSPPKAAGDVAKGLVDIRDTVKFGEAVIRLQGQILSAQQGALAAQSRESELGDEIRVLKARVAEVEGWEAEKKRYALEELPPGVFVYSLKPAMANGEPAHKLCQTCYQRGKKSILHAGEPSSGQYNLTCHECGVNLTIGTYQPPPRTRRRSDGW
jgi:hypothetical protein